MLKKKDKQIMKISYVTTHQSKKFGTESDEDMFINDWFREKSILQEQNFKSYL